MKVSALRRVLVLVALVGIIASFAAPANAASPLRGKLICVATGLTSVSTPDPANPDTVNWTIKARGLCTGDAMGPYIATVDATGTSTDLGLCDNLIVQNLNLNVTLTLDSLTRNVITVVNQTWYAPLTTFPIATPFFVANDSGTLAGAGVLGTRFALKCPPLGKEASNFAWAFLRP